MQRLNHDMQALKEAAARINLEKEYDRVRRTLARLSSLASKHLELPEDLRKYMYGEENENV